jgi:putative hydroxymethylpyrimidine transport system substrate-binding protein
MTLIFDWIPNSTHFFYFDAVKQGYYADECLDVKYLTPGDVTVPSKVVADGSKAQVGIVLAPDVVFGQNTGQPIKSIFTLWQDSEYGILTLSDVKSPKDFEGHKVALLANFEKSAFAQMMKKAGGDASKVDVIQAGFSVVPPVVGKKVMGATGGAIYELPECTAQLGPGKCKLFKYEDYGYPPEQLVVIANTNWAKTHGDVLRRFTKASLMGLAYSIAHPAASTANFAKQFPDTNQKTTLAIYKRIIPAEQSAATKANGLGYQEPAVWAALLTALQNDMGVSKTLKPSDLFTNAYLPSPPIH